MSDDEKSVLQFFGRHLVALCVTFRYIDKTDELIDPASFIGRFNRKPIFRS